jgi:ComF family protein
VSTRQCAECPPAVDRLQFAAAYVDPLPLVIGALKDHGRRDLASELARLIASRCAGPPEGVGLTPVPLTRGRERDRGFNQADLIAAHLAKVWDRPVVQLLQRVRDDPPQRGASATDRRLHVRGAFAVTPQSPIPPETWIVDDVCTTGATLAACARTLRRAGVGRVAAVTVARVLRQP